ncbi:MAG TPA: GGDEF domain-containing protein [Myxococcota bacterium]
MSDAASQNAADSSSRGRALRVGALLGAAFLLASAGWDYAVAPGQIEKLVLWRLGTAVVIGAVGLLSYAFDKRALWLGAAMSGLSALSIGGMVGTLPYGLTYGIGAFVIIAMVIGFVSLDGKAALASALAAIVGGGIGLVLGGASIEPALAVSFFFLPASVGAVLFAHVTHLRVGRNRDLRRELASLREDLARFGRSDELTGVHDEKQLQQLARREIALARRRKSPLSALKIDVERLDDINQRHGRAAGDETLRAVASMCQATLRETDLLARLHAGDEFAAVLPEADATGAATICDRLRKGLAKASILAGEQLLTVTVNVASATLGEGDQGIDDLLKRADADLRAQKS